MNSDFAARLERHAPLIRNVRVPLAILAAGVFAYRMLFYYAPYTGIQGVGDETESIFFAPNESSPLLIFLVTAWLLLGRRLQIANAIGAKPALAASAVFLSLSVGL
jgi:drug/metabolite transporter (DMT)-like permease